MPGNIKSGIANNIFTISILIAFGCNKSSDLPLEKINLKYNIETIWKCHYKSAWNINTIKAKVVGVWEWRYIECCGESTKPYQNETEAKGLKIQFNNNGTGILIDNDAIGDFTWNIVPRDNDSFGLNCIPLISSLAGRILFCDDIMMCNNGYVDGVNNYYEKQK